MNCYMHRASLLLILFAMCAGCNGNAYPPVSGKVTSNGKPVPGLTVVFTPVGSASAPTPGPYSTGVTDARGEFTLRTRHNDGGAVPGPHRVGFEYGDKDELNELKFELREADEESKPAIEQRIDELKTLVKSRVKVPTKVISRFNVPKVGTSSAHLELNQELTQE